MKYIYYSLLILTFVSLVGVSLSFAKIDTRFTGLSPRNIHIQRIESYLLLTWRQPLKKVDGYRIYRSTTRKILGDIITTINNPEMNSFTDSTVLPAKKYYYTVHGFLSSGLESINKKQVNQAAARSRPTFIPGPASQFQSPETPQALPTVSFEASTLSITQGQSTTLVWTSNNTNYCLASREWPGGQPTLSGSRMVSPQSTTTYTLTCTGHGVPVARSVTVIVHPNDLGDRYRRRPTQAEIDQIMGDFNLEWTDDTTPGREERWPNDFLFDQTSTQQSKMVIISRLNILKHQTFSEPLPFTNLSVYDFVKTYIRHIVIPIHCNNSPPTTSDQRALFMNLGSGNWFSLTGATCDFGDFFNPYMNQLPVLVHEARHGMPDDPRHTSCGITNGNDQYFENGSGYAYAVMYTMWVYKYGIDDPPAEKEWAKQMAITLLQNRFCTAPKHSNPKVQAIIDELLR